VLLWCLGEVLTLSHHPWEGTFDGEKRPEKRNLAMTRLSPIESQSYQSKLSFYTCLRSNGLVSHYQ
jgi:hypothetical protein